MSYSGNGYPTDAGLELTTKGQIHSYTTENAGLSVSGNSGYVLTENPSTATGLEWVENAHSSVTADSTTTFTNKSIAFSGNTITGTLAELDTAIGTTGTASSSTYLRGDNSWSTISAGASASDNITIGAVTKTLGTWLTLGA